MIGELPGVDVVAQSLRNLGASTALAVIVLRGVVRGRPTWVREAAIQGVFVLRSASQPALAVNLIFATSIIGLALGVPLDQIGADDRNAAFLGVGLMREFGVVMTGAVLAGVIGTTYTAELGARKIRNELDAMAVLGIEPIQAMVVPRAVAMCLMAPVIFLVSVSIGALGVFLATTTYFGAPAGPFFPQFLSNTSWIDLWSSLAKVMVLGFVITVISCAKGMAVEGGAAGVGRAVNESVVACLMAVFFVNIVWTTILLGAFPDLQAFR